MATQSSNGSTIPSSSGSNSSFTNIHTDERLVVAVRIRPLGDAAESNCIQVLSRGTLSFDEGTRNKPKKYNYDHVFGESSSQEEVYQTTTAPLVQDVLNGYNAAVFAYGATGSGKTHTMLGPNPRKAATSGGGSSGEQQDSTAEATSGGGKSSPQGNEGLMIKAVADIFKFIEESEHPDNFK
ncbi:hypothetical protein pipiens_004249, partial [Culex pipiens pipiens]